MKNTFAVIGLGQFGMSLARELIKNDSDVLVIDVDAKKVQEISKYATHAVICDSTNEAALEEVGIRSIDVVIVAIGENVQASILTTAMLIDLGIKNIMVKVDTDYHAKVVEKLGVTTLIRPEVSTARRMARSLVAININDLIELNNEYSIVEIRCSKKTIGQTMIELDLRKRFNINVVAIRREDAIIIPDPNEPLIAGDILVLIAENQMIKKASEHL